MSMAGDRRIKSKSTERAVPCRPSFGVRYKVLVDSFRVHEFTVEEALDVHRLRELREDYARQHDISRAGVQIVEEKHLRKNKNLRRDIQICEDYAAGATMREIAGDTRLTIEGVRLVLKKYQQKRNQRGYRHPDKRPVMLYRIYVNGSLASVEKYPEMNGQELDEFGLKWAKERRVGGSTIEIYPWMEE